MSEIGVWLGQVKVLKGAPGVCYVAEMLSHPRERIKKLNLVAKYSSPRSPGGSGIEIYDPATGQFEPPASLEPVQEAALAVDDLEARRAYQARAWELRETIGDPTETERAKVEAREELAAIAAHLSKDSRPVRDPTKTAADAVRIGIHRFLRNLVGRGDTVASPLAGAAWICEASAALPARAEQPLRGPRRPQGERRVDRLPALRPARRNSLGGEPVTGFPTRQLLSPHRG